MPDFSAPMISYSYNYTCYLNIKLELPPLDHKDGKIPLHLLKKKILHVLMNGQLHITETFQMGKHDRLNFIS